MVIINMFASLNKSLKLFQIQYNLLNLLGREWTTTTRNSRHVTPIQPKTLLHTTDVQ